MSHPYNNFQNNLQQTSLNNAYQFQSFSQYINDGKLNATFSPICVFCSSNNTKSLTNDHSFKQCYGCKKQFKSRFV